jgi:hypothetical protein
MPWPMKKLPPTFKDQELFCATCLVHDHYWSGGGASGIDSCPDCGSQETIAWINMTAFQRALAARVNPELHRGCAHG